MLYQVEGHAACKLYDRTFGSAVSGLSRFCCDAQNRSDINNAAGASSRNKTSGTLLCNIPYAVEISVHDKITRFIINFQKAFGVGDTCVIDDDLNWTECRFALLVSGIDTVSVGNVHAYGHGLTSSVFNLADQLM